MSKVVTVDGLVDEAGLTFRLWREDSGASWTIVHELYDGERLVRRDSWVNFKGNGQPQAGSEQGGFGNG